MKPTVRVALCIFTGLTFATCHCQAQSSGKREDGWQATQEDGTSVQTRKLLIHPQGEPKPALRYQLIPNEFDAIDGNAAIYYLKAMGYLEQNSARDRIRQANKDAVTKSNEEGIDMGDLPPAVWLNTPPEELPIDEVSEYLSWIGFQKPMLREAALRNQFDMDRRFREVENPVAYLLPEIQNLRELARNQSLRCRLAMAEGRIDDAIEIIGQQFALARHLGQDDFLVSNLVGIAISSIAWNDALYLVQHPDAPNLYWALTSMPFPLVDMRRSMAYEREFLYQQIKVLREVDERPRADAYWQDFIDRMIPQIGILAEDLKIPSPTEKPEAARAALVGFVAAAYPGAKEFLLTEEKMPRKQVESYPNAQVVFLAMARFYEQWRDQFFKWNYLPYWQSDAKVKANELDKRMRDASDRYGWCTAPTMLFLPAIRAARTAAARSVQNISMLRTVEAIRMYAAENEGQLPPTLDHLSVPTPIEPFTGKPMQYELIADHGLITGHKLPGLQYRVVVRVAE